MYFHIAELRIFAYNNFLRQQILIEDILPNNGTLIL